MYGFEDLLLVVKSHFRFPSYCTATKMQFSLSGHPMRLWICLLWFPLKPAHTQTSNSHVDLDGLLTLSANHV